MVLFLGVYFIHNQNKYIHECTRTVKSWMKGVLLAPGLTLPVLIKKKMAHTVIRLTWFRACCPFHMRFL